MEALAGKTSYLQDATEAAYSFAQLTSKPAWNIIGGILSNAVNREQKGLTAWPPQSLLKNIALPGKEIIKLLAICHDEHQQCLRLTTAWFCCVLKMMQTIHLDAQRCKDPAGTLTACRETAAQYNQSFRDFLGGQMSLARQAMNFRLTGVPAQEKSP